MKLDPYIGDVRMAMAFATDPDDPNPAYVDVTDYVLSAQGISFTHGRLDEYSEVPACMMAWTFDNTTGYFTSDYSGSPWYPNVEVLRKVHVDLRLAGVSGNGFSDPLFAAGTLLDWAPGGNPAPAVALSSTRFLAGTQSMLITWAAGNVFLPAAVASMTCVIGRQYTVLVSVWVPASNPAVRLIIGGGGLLTGGAFSSTTGAWQLIFVTFTATAQTHSINLCPNGAPTAGQQCWVANPMWDEGALAAFTATPLIGSATNLGGPIWPRYTGYTNEFPTSYPGGGQYCEAAMTAVDQFSRLGDDAELDSMLIEEYNVDGPFAHYTLGEPAGALRAGDTSSNGCGALSIIQLGAGGTLVFGSATGPGSDGLTALQLVPVNPGNGRYLSGNLNVATSLFSRGHSVDLFFLTSVANSQTMLLASGVYGEVLRLAIDGSGHLAGVFGAGGVILTSPGAVADGGTHHAAAVETISGTTVTCKLYLDGSLVGTSTYTAPYGLMRTMNALSVGGGASVVFAGTLAHAAVYDSELTASRVADHAAGGLVGFSGERSDQRIARLGRYVGISASQMVLDVGLSSSIGAVATSGVAPLSAMQGVEETESGVLFVDGLGRLTFHARSRRYNTSSVLTFVGEDLDPAASSFVRNRAYLVNEVLASRPGGVIVRAVNAASRARYGKRRKNLTLLVTTDTEVVDAANWRANQSAQLTARLTSLTIDLLTNAGIAAGIANVLALEVSSRISLASLPATAPAMTDQFIEGWAERITDGSYQLAFNTSPALQSSAWVLDSATHSQLDSTTRLVY